MILEERLLPFLIFVIIFQSNLKRKKRIISGFGMSWLLLMALLKCERVTQKRTRNSSISFSAVDKLFSREKEGRKKETKKERRSIEAEPSRAEPLIHENFDLSFLSFWYSHQDESLQYLHCLSKLTKDVKEKSKRSSGNEKNLLLINSM